LDFDTNIRMKKFTDKIISNNPPDLNSDYNQADTRLHRFPNEAIYIYSLDKQTMVYLSGWDELLGYKNHEITLSLLVSLNLPEYAEFCEEMNYRALTLAFSLHENFDQYCCLIETKKMNKRGEIIPLIENAGIYKTENGRITEIIARYQQIKISRLNNIRYFELYGPNREKMEDVFADVADNHQAVSGKEREVLVLAAKGLSLKEIADNLQLSHSAIEKRLISLYRRFELKSLTHLISFAYEKGILP
jgi:DNA-binding CsgD family transcriptional regulator